MTLAQRFWSKVNKGDGCWAWTSAVGTDGYGAFGVYRPEDARRLGGCGKNMRAHRAAWILSGRELPPPGFVLMHSCDNPLCVRPDHLSVGTARDNSLDAARKVRLRGQVISPEEARRIREEAASGEPLALIAERHRIKEHTVSCIATGKSHRADPGPRSRRRTTSATKTDLWEMA